MARKHFDEYYNAIVKQYLQLNDVMKELSQEVDNGMRTPESLDQLNATILPVQDSYRTLSYIKYLLDKPTRNSKEKAYNKRSRNLLIASMGRQAKDLIEDNIKALDDAKI